ncbi:unnamed protein product, partial [marine sediment metagenome]
MVSNEEFARILLGKKLITDAQVEEVLVESKA